MCRYEQEPSTQTPTGAYKHVHAASLGYSLSFWKTKVIGFKIYSLNLNIFLG